MKKLLFLTLILSSLMSVSCMKRIEGILREQPSEISKKEAVKLMNYYNGQLSVAESLLKEDKIEDLSTYLKSPEWALAEGCHTKLTQLPPELATEMNIAVMEGHFIEFVNQVIKKGIPLREIEED